jgi:endo-1,4-beta-xylanase
VIKPRLDRLARFGLPIKITEFDNRTDNEQQKAKDLTEFYTICFAHPAVEGILMWDFYRPLHWRPKAGLWEEDFTPNAAGLAYNDLVYNQWWTKEKVKADSKGICKVRAFFGKHFIESNGKKIKVYLGKKDGQQTIELN